MYWTSGHGIVNNHECLCTYCLYILVTTMPFLARWKWLIMLVWKSWMLRPAFSKFNLPLFINKRQIRQAFFWTWSRLDLAHNIFKIKYIIVSCISAVNPVLLRCCIPENLQLTGPPMINKQDSGTPGWMFVNWMSSFCCKIYFSMKPAHKHKREP